MRRGSSLHVRLYRWFVKLMPQAHRERHGDDQVQLFADLVATGHRPTRLWAAAIPDLLAVLSVHPRRIVMSQLARIALYPLSMLNAAAGLALTLAALATDAVPVEVAAFGAAIAAQGLYGLAWLNDRVPLAPRISNLLFAVGEALALVIGTTGVVASLVRQSATTDPEYGPPTLLTLVAVHAVVGLLCSAERTTNDAVRVS